MIAEKRKLFFSFSFLQMMCMHTAQACPCRGGTAFHTRFIKTSAPDQQQLEAELLLPHRVAQNGLQ